MSTEDQKARVDALMALADDYAQAVSAVDTSTHECWRSIDYRNKRIAEQHAAREALRLALMSNAAPEVDRSAERVEAAQLVAPANLPHSHAQFWLTNRSAILQAISDHGLTLVSNVRGFKLIKLGAIHAQADPLQALHDSAQELGAKG